MRLSLFHSPPVAKKAAHDNAWISQAGFLLARLAEESHPTESAQHQRQLISMTIAVTNADKALTKRAAELAGIIGGQESSRVAQSCVGRHELLRTTNSEIEAVLQLGSMLDTRQWLQAGALVAQRRPLTSEESFTGEGRRALRTEIDERIAHLFPHRLERIPASPAQRLHVLHDVTLLGFDVIARRLAKLDELASMSVGQLALICAHEGCKALFADEKSAMARAVNARFVEEVLAQPQE